MNCVVNVDHLSIRVSDFRKSKTFYGKLFEFLGFTVLDEYDDAIGWTNRCTRFWIGQADAHGRRKKHRIGDVGFHHYAFELRSRADVDALQAFLKKRRLKIVDPADGILRGLLRRVLSRSRRFEARRLQVGRKVG